MADVVRLGVVGAGNFTRRRLLPNFLAVPGVQVTAVANSSLTSSEKVAQEFDVPVALPDWRALVARDDVDAVIVGTQPYLHRDVVMAALDAGKHVLCLPRMATSLSEAREMAAKAEASGLQAMVLGTSAVAPVNRYVKHLIEDGFVGRVRQVFASAFIADYIDSEASLHRRQDHRKFGAINPMSLGSSWDMLRGWFGDAERVLAWRKAFTPSRPDGPGGPPIQVEMPEAVTVVAETAQGTTVTCIQSGVVRFGQDRIEIFGEHGSLILSHGELSGAGSGDSELHSLPIPPEYQAPIDLEADFIRMIRGDVSQAPFSFAEAAKNIEFLEAAHRSGHEGRWVSLPLS